MLWISLMGIWIDRAVHQVDVFNHCGYDRSLVLGGFFAGCDVLEMLETQKVAKNPDDV